MSARQDELDRLGDLVDRMEALAAKSEGDLGVIRIPWGSKYELSRDGRWMDATDALYEEVSPTDIASDIGLEQFIAIMSRWLEDET